MIEIGLTKNPRITADELSEKSGLDVFVPDIFNGNPLPSSQLKYHPETPGGTTSFGNGVCSNEISIFSKERTNSFFLI